MFHRFHRYRSLKTRAKQIDKIRRQSRWDWDNARHIRSASHCGGPEYHTRKHDGDDRRGSRQELTEEDGCELTDGEKQWKENMERMRTRIEQDPYEAVFGKRFQPFWSPLLNPLLRWNGEELSLKTDSPTGAKPKPADIKKTPEPVKVDIPATKSKTDRELETDSPNGQLTNYSYTASTAWDSKTNKTRGQEWDSISGTTKSFEYDPITNRMREVQNSPPSNPTTLSNSASGSKSAADTLTSPSQKESRKPIEVPTSTVNDINKTPVYFPSLLNTTVAASPAKTSAITEAPENDIDLLTAEDVRASMRGRHERAHFTPPSGVSKAATLQSSLQRMQKKEFPEPSEPDDSAAHESTGDNVQWNRVPRDWYKQADLLQASRILRTRGVAKEEHVRLPADNDPTYTPADFKPPTVYQHGRKVEENGRRIEEHERTPADNDPTLDRFARFEPPTVFMNGGKVEENGRKIEHDELARTPFDNDPTMDINDSNFKPPTVYKNGRKVEENGVKLQQPTESEMSQAKPVDDAAAADQRSKYQQKVAELKKELDLSYKQSTINSEMHVERIRELERALQKARHNDADKAKGPEHTQAEGDIDVAVSKYAKDSSRWYKQPVYHANVELENKVSPAVSSRDTIIDDALAKTESEFGITYNGATREDTAELVKEMAEKDRQASEASAGRNPYPDSHSTTVDTEMAQKYQHKPEDTNRLLADYAEKDRQSRESSAGRNPFPDPLASKVDREMSEKFKHKSEDTSELLAEYAEQDRQIRESRAGRNPFTNPLTIQVDKEMAEKYKYKPEDTTELLQADAQREKDWVEYMAKKKADASLTETQKIQWAEPPVYKVLAYDSGNDMFSTATTSSNFTTHETPISIQDALSELYQPARFVPHFAELQKEGYQVIYGTKDLLLFRKRKEATSSTMGCSGSKHSDTQAEPITSLIEPVMSNTTKPSAANGTLQGIPEETNTNLPDDMGVPSYVSPGSPNHKGSTTVKVEDMDQMHDAKKNETEQTPRVHREERVFSGRKKGRRHRSELTAEEIALLRELKNHGSGWASRLRWALGVGLGASAVAYGVGAVVEKKEMRDRERWEDIVERTYPRRSS